MIQVGSDEGLEILVPVVDLASGVKTHAAESKAIL
jgi:hypothetical protein